VQKLRKSTLECPVEKRKEMRLCKVSDFIDIILVGKWKFVSPPGQTNVCGDFTVLITFTFSPKILPSN